jgi:arylsulfatase A-like enzyme
MSLSGSGQKKESDKAGPKPSLLSFWRKEFGRTDPTRTGDLIVFPLAVSATAGLITGICFTAHRHFLDPAFIAYSTIVDVGLQLVILALVLALASITRRRVWSGILFAIGLFCFLAIPDLIKIVLPGVAHPLAWCIGLLGAFQIARSVNRHRHSRVAGWMIAVPALVAVCVLSYGMAREYSQMSTLPGAPNSPNVLVIIVDSLRADHLSPYGYSRDTSPYLTQFAKEGVLFENAIAPASWTLPSHASMLTGLSPHQARVEMGGDILSSRFPTLADAMRERGFRTAAFSANYQFFARDHGFIHGFSHFEEYDQTLGGILEKVPLSQLVLKELSHLTTGEKFAFFGIKNAPSAEKIDDNAVAWIRRGRRPFFVVLNYLDVHGPVLPPEPYLHMYTTNAKARNESMYFPENCGYYDVKELCTPETPQFVDTYDGSMRYVDENIQHMLADLGERGILKNTIVVFTSDHGQEFGEHGMFGHGKSLYRREIQVPLIIWKPGLIPAAVRLTTPVSTTDLPATILDLTGFGPDQAQSQSGNQPMPGHSLAPLWRSGQPVSDWPAPISQLARLHWFDKAAANYNSEVRSIVTPEWHFIHQQNKDLLFDWKADPDELHDVSAAQPAVCSDLRSRIQAAEGTQPQTH